MEQKKKTVKKQNLFLSPNTTSAYADGIQVGVDKEHNNCSLIFYHTVMNQNFETTRVVLPADVMKKGLDILSKALDHYPTKDEVKKK